MFSKRSLEGYVSIDHRDSPGVSEEFVRASGRDAVAVPGGRQLEAATLTCGHCQAGIIVNPKRNRDRGWCPKCDRYLCDTCEAVRARAGGTCSYFKRLIDLTMTNAAMTTLKAIRELRRDILG